MIELIDFNKEEKHYIKQQILKDIFDVNVKAFGIDVATAVHKVGIDVRVKWTKAWRKDKFNIPSSYAVLPHLNYSIPYDWRRKGVRGSYNEFGFYYMSSTEYDRNVKLQELLK